MVKQGIALSGGIVGAGCELTRPAPTRPGDALHVSGEVVAVVPALSGRERGTIRLRSETVYQNVVVVKVMIARLVVQRRDTKGAFSPSAPDYHKGVIDNKRRRKGVQLAVRHLYAMLRLLFDDAIRAASVYSTKASALLGMPALTTDIAR